VDALPLPRSNTFAEASYTSSEKHGCLMPSPYQLPRAWWWSIDACRSGIFACLYMSEWAEQTAASSLSFTAKYRKHLISLHGRMWFARISIFC